MEILFLVLGLVAIGIATFFAYKNKHDAKECITSITLGVFFATFFMVLPTQWVKEGKEVFCEPLYSILSALLYSLKSLGGRQDIAQLETMSLPTVLKAVYIVLSYICFALAPILASSLILSFVGDTGEKMRFMLQRTPKCYVFSEINENALALAEGIKNQKGKKTIVFCKGKNADKEQVVRAKKLGGIVLYQSCSKLAKLHRFDTCEFFLISADEDGNISLAEAIIAKQDGVKDIAIVINAFMESGTNVKFLESVVKDKSQNTNIELRCIDEIALLCNHLIYNHPLYNTKGNGTDISIAIIGCGAMGMRMLKTAYWAGQIDGCNLKIRVYDQAANARKADFHRQCPGLKNEESIQFVQVDADSMSFEENLLKPENSADATYIVVAMGDDQLNLSVADRLYQIYRRHFSFQTDRLPEILTRVRSQTKSNSLFHNTSFLKERNIHLFGTTASVFSDKTLFNTDFENLALAVHLTYWDQMPPDKNTEKYTAALKNFRTSEYDRRSSMAAALHIPAKLWMCDKTLRTKENILTPENLQIYSNRIANDSDLFLRLAINEHRRWNAFMLTEGYLPASINQLHQYAQSVGSHKDDLSMLHPCIVDWADLDELENIYNSSYGKSKKFKKYDKAIVEKVSEIWAVAQKTTGWHDRV